MRVRPILLTASAITGASIGAALWHFWTPRCNELCPSWVALSMIGAVLLCPIAGVLAGGIVGAKSRPPAWRLRAGGMLLAVVATAIAVLSLAVH